MLEPLETGLVIGPAILGRQNSPIAREVGFSVPVGEAILARADDERRDRPAFRIDRLNNCNPFPVSRLH